jgi:carboxyl-terminal processing protease
MQNDQTPINTPSNHVPASVHVPPKSHKAPFHVGYILFALALFALGLFMGQGKIDFLSQQQYETRSNLPATLDYSQLDDLYTTLRTNYDGTLTSQQIIDGLKHGLASSTKDPYTEYMSATEATDFQSSLQGEITGIGAQLALDDDNNVIIQSPIAGSPAEAAGLRAKDLVATIDGKSTYGMTVNDAVTKIRGKKGSKVTLGIVRNSKESLSFTITRDVIKIPTVVSKTLSDGQIGYLQVSQFSDDTDELVQKAAAKFKADGVKKIILDLRDNPGGEVTTAVNLSSLWLHSGDVVVSQRRGSTTTDTENAGGVNTLQGVKTVVLINAGSASASEITALALRDHNVATIMGETSYGKGVVQQLFPFSDGSSLKVTVAKWYSPKGTNINKTGVKPDKEVKLTEEDYKNGTDSQLTAAENYLNQ